MSYLVADLEVFNAVADKIKSFQYSKVCDINYCNTLSFTDLQCEILVKNWLTLNELTVTARYEETVTPPKFAQFLEANPYRGDRISTLQLLKYLQCIEINICTRIITEGYDSNRKGYGEGVLSMDLKDSLETLKRGIKELTLSVISEYTDYKKLKWSNI